MDGEHLLRSYSEASRRHAILVDDGRTGILYLHAPSDDPATTGEVEGTCFAFNRVDPIELKDVRNYRLTPPIAKGFASADAVCLAPEAHAWRLIWSADGTAVVLTQDDEAWAIASVEARRGYSKALQTEGPWGSPWSNERYAATTWEGLADHHG